MRFIRQLGIPVELEEAELSAGCSRCLVNVALDNLPGFWEVGQEDVGVGDCLGKGDADNATASSQFEDSQGRGFCGVQQSLC